MLAQVHLSVLNTVTIGSNLQPVSLIFDTGSSVTWVNPDCSKTIDSHPRRREECFKLPRYNPVTSKTSRIQDRALNMTYGLGGVLGSYFNDEFKIGSIVACNATFGVAVTSWDLEAGVFGARARASYAPPTIIETLAAQGQMNSYVFSVDLKPLDQSGENDNSRGARIR